MDRIDTARLSRPAPAERASPQRLAAAAQRRYTHGAAPPLQRGSMGAVPWRGFIASVRGPTHGRGVTPAADPLAGRLRGWQRAAAKRRHALVGLVMLAATGSAALLLQSQPPRGFALAQLAQTLLFTLLFAWVAAGFVTACMGWVVLRRGDRHMLSYHRVAQAPIACGARTAIVMPICNEHVPTVFGNLAATAESVVAAGGARLAELYLLSDSTDPSVRAAERRAWELLQARFAASGLRVHYRWRLRRTRRKAGNVADFCRRWGRLFRYMVVLDADSVMSGEAVLGLVRLMESQPKAGIIQSAPVACGVDTLHARAQQFAGRVTGRLFSAGMQYWQLGESHYWGHNAIIRIAPFMAHCGLAPLAGRGGLAGDILSHDFVEAALMRRAGWQVWLVTDLPGSWEQQPPHLLAELQRDRRWCQGNLQNARLIAEPGLHRVHRAMFATGAMAYLSAPLWLAFVVLGLVLWLTGGHSFGSTQHGWPQPVLLLWGATVAMLMLPRVLGVALVVREGRQALFGGSVALVISAALEWLISALQAPVRMAAHTLFVLAAVSGLHLQWKSPPRQAGRLLWRDAAPALLPLSLLAGVTLAAAALAGSSVALWLAPVALPLALAWPLAVWCSRPALGVWLQRAGLLVTPEESAPPRVLQQAWTELARGASTARVVALDSRRLRHRTGAQPLAAASVNEAPTGTALVPASAARRTIAPAAPSRGSVRHA